MTGQRENPAILRRVAQTALEDARAAWKKAQATPTAEHTRAAYRSCVLAARALRRAANVLPREAEQMLEQAATIDATADNLGAELVSLEVVAELANTAKT